jgi:hypothetical protein
MNWDAIGALSELVGALAVVATLLYLAVQIRQNTTSVRAATFQSIMGAATAFNETLSRDSDLMRVFTTGLTGLGALEREDAARFHFQLLSLVRRGENFHYQMELGLLEDEAWEGLRNSMLQLLGTPGARSWWKQNERLINSTFRSFIERQLPPPR